MSARVKSTQRQCNNVPPTGNTNKYMVPQMIRADGRLILVKICRGELLSSYHLADSRPRWDCLCARCCGEKRRLSKERPLPPDTPCSTAVERPRRSAGLCSVCWSRREGGPLGSVICCWSFLSSFSVLVWGRRTRWDAHRPRTAVLSSCKRVPAFWTRLHSCMQDHGDVRVFSTTPVLPNHLTDFVLK